MMAGTITHFEIYVRIWTDGWMDGGLCEYECML